VRRTRGNTALSAIRAAAAYWTEQGWLTADPPRRCGDGGHVPTAPGARPRRRRGAAHREDIPLRERTLWRMLYETAARLRRGLGLDVPDLDLPNRRARVRRKGGQLDMNRVADRTARLLLRLLKGRTAGRCF